MCRGLCVCVAIDCGPPNATVNDTFIRMASVPANTMYGANFSIVCDKVGWTMQNMNSKAGAKALYCTTSALWVDSAGTKLSVLRCDTRMLTI